MNKDSRLQWIWLIAAAVIIASFLYYQLSAKAAKKADYSGWSNYAESVANCTSEEFILMEPGFPNAKPEELQGVRVGKGWQFYKVHGWNEDSCIVSNKDNPQPGVVTTGIQYCTFPKSALGVVSKYAQEIASGEKVTAEKDYIQILKKYCMVAY
jgi:hypothetical protein